jgi:hypothetical protein
MRLVNSVLAAITIGVFAQITQGQVSYPPPDTSQYANAAQASAAATKADQALHAATAAQVAAASAVKSVGGNAPDASGNVPLSNSFVAASCAGCTMSNLTMTGSVVANGASVATATDLAGQTAAMNAAIAAIVFPVTSVNGSTGAINVPVYTDSMAVAATTPAINGVTNLAKAAAADSIQIATPATGGTVTSLTGTNVLFINNTGVLASLTVTFPPNPVDGQRFTVASNNTITTLGFAGATSRGAASTLAVSGYARFVWSTTLGVWFRVG